MPLHHVFVATYVSNCIGPSLDKCNVILSGNAKALNHYYQHKLCTIIEQGHRSALIKTQQRRVS